jgi:hypothetical protein
LKSNGNHSEVIIGVGALAEFLKVSKPTVQQYLRMGMPGLKINNTFRMGMPGLKINNTWHFTVKNINKWFDTVTWQKPNPKDIDFDAVK